jgi:RNA polymerase sigma-70 factor (ECF subfamily)
MESFDPDLIKDYIKPVYNFVYRLIGKPEEAEDLTQETFLKALKNIKSFDETKNFKTWLFTIARNTVTDFYRKKKTLNFSSLNSRDEDSEPFESTLASGGLSPEEIFEKKEEELVLLGALGCLNIDERTIIVLHHTDGLTFEEIGQVVDKPMNTVKSTYRRALEKLRRAMEHQNEG